MTGRARAGWLADAAAPSEIAIIIHSMSGLCITKLDVLTDLKEIRSASATGWATSNQTSLPLDARRHRRLPANPSTRPGRAGSDSTWELTSTGEQLPANARRYLERVQSLIGAHRHGVHRP